MAPEVYLRGPVGKEVDIWALGVVFFQALTGKMPFKTPIEIKFDEPDIPDSVSD